MPVGVLNRSLGRALEWHSRGQRFDPAYLHQRKTLKPYWFQGFLFCPHGRGGLRPAFAACSAELLHLPPQAGDDALFQAGDVRLGDAHAVGYLLLGQLLPASQAKPQGDDVLLPGRQPGYCLRQELAVHVGLDGPHDHVTVGAQHVGQQQLLAVPVGVQGLVKADLRALGGIFPQVHEDLIFDAAGGVGGQLDVLVGPKGVDGLDEADGADGDQVLDVDAGVLKPAGDVHHQPQVSLDEGLTGQQLPSLQAGDPLRLLLPGQRRRQRVAAADVHDLIRPAVQPPQKPPQQFHDAAPFFRPTGPDSPRRR